MRYIGLFFCLSLLIALPMAAEVTTNESVAITLSTWVPCANGGSGETIMLSGSLHVLTAVTEDEAGGMHVKQHFQPQGLTGVGLTTGAKYQGTGVTQEQFSVRPPYPVTDTYVNNFRMIGQGKGNNLLIHSTYHVTVNADGTVTTEIDNYSFECR